MKQLSLKSGNLSNDMFGGLTAAIVALPLALAFGVQSGLGAASGMYGAIFLGFFAALLGGTIIQISGPTGPMTVISASVVVLFIEKTGDLNSAIGLILITFLLAGLFQILFGVLKIGNYIKYIPYPVLSGFMSGIGLIIIFLQLFPLIGLVSPKKIIDVFTQMPDAVSKINYGALIMSAITLVIIYLFPKITKKVPSTLIALLVVTLVVYFFKIDIPLIGDIPTGLPKIMISDIFNIDPKLLSLTIAPAITLAALGVIDSLLTSVVADNITKTRHNSNKEIIGQGIGNAIASIFGGLPGAGATMRTVVNIKAGGKTRLSGVVHSLILFVVMLGASSLVKYIPLSVLAGILISVGISIIDIKGVKDLFKIPKADAFVLVIVLVLTVFVDLIKAVGIGMIIASVLFMKRASDLVDKGTSVAPSKPSDAEFTWTDEDIIPEDIHNKIYIIRLDGPVFFGSVAKLQQSINSIPNNIQAVIIRMRKVPFIDQSGVYTLENIIDDLQKKEITILFTMLQNQPKYMLEKVNIIPDKIPNELVFDTFPDSAQWLKNNIK